MSLHITHLSKHCRFSNGNVHAAVDLAVAQAAAGHAVSFLSAGGDFVEFLGKHGVEHVPLPSLGSDRALLLATFEVGRFIRARRPQVLHAHMMGAALAAYPGSRLFRTPLVTTVHNAFDRHAVLMRLGDRVICGSEAVRADMARKGFNPASLRVILPGTVGVRRRDAASGPSDVGTLHRPSIGTLCGMHPRKGVDLLLEAHARITAESPEVHLYVAGDGPYLQAYRKQADQLGLSSSQITFLGAIHDTRRYLQQLDVFVLASRAEPSGLVITEAREAGCAIVAANVGGIPEMVDGKGVLFAPDSVEALLEALRAVIADPVEMNRLRYVAGLDMEAFHISAVAALYDAVYREMVVLPSSLPSGVQS